MDMKVFSGTANIPLYDEVVGNLVRRTYPINGDKISTIRGNVKLEKFKDGEIFAQFQDDIRGKDVFLMQSMSDPVNDNIMELLIMIDAAKRASAARVTAVIPFYAYARQDRKDKPRVPITAKLLANLIVSSGADRVVAMDLHCDQIQGFFDIPVDHLYSFPVFLETFRMMFTPKMLKEKVVFLSPDAGSAKRAVNYASKLGCGFAICSKQRKNGETIETVGLVGNVKGKTVIIMDDLTTTGGTLIGAANMAKKHGAKEIIAGVTHNVASKEAIEKISDPDVCAIDQLFVTDTVKGSNSDDGFVEVLTVSNLIATAIGCIHDNNSVSSLFNV